MEAILDVGRLLRGGDIWAETQIKEKTKQEHVQKSIIHNREGSHCITQIWPFCPLLFFNSPNSLLLIQRICASLKCLSPI